MKSITNITGIVAIIAAIVLLLLDGHQAQGQVFDQLLRRVESQAQSNQYNNEVGVRQDAQTKSLGVKIPMFYDMTKNGRDLGINVLSGLVKVERGEPASRSGLAGPNPLSVRIFGIPVYERGNRVNVPDNAQPEYETNVNNVPVPEGPDGPVDPSG